MCGMFEGNLGFGAAPERKLKRMKPLKLRIPKMKKEKKEKAEKRLTKKQEYAVEAKRLQERKEEKEYAGKLRAVKSEHKELTSEEWAGRKRKAKRVAGKVKGFFTGLKSGKRKKSIYGDEGIFNP